MLYQHAFKSTHKIYSGSYCLSYQQLTDLIRPLVDHRDAVDLPEFISYMDQTYEEERDTVKAQIEWAETSMKIKEASQSFLGLWGLSVVS